MPAPDANRPPDPSNPGSTMPPEGSPARRRLRERVDWMLERLVDELEGYPLVTPPVVRSGLALYCLDCEVIFEAEGPQKCPRCAGETTIRFLPKPLLPVGDEKPLDPALNAVAAEREETADATAPV